MSREQWFEGFGVVAPNSNRMLLIWGKMIRESMKDLTKTRSLRKRKISGKRRVNEKWLRESRNILAELETLYGKKCWTLLYVWRITQIDSETRGMRTGVYTWLVPLTSTGDIKGILSIPVEKEDLIRVIEPVCFVLKHINFSMERENGRVRIVTDSRW
ncbi:hypothetical protein L1987_47192 [Smallanthus sonchifolius]|uniref:Uncharacterized protein n=1 Tax=Smallanthus sonchifolius TaxID=185202 RepID=A0ACB9G1P5_9ASTR|nr:hypothetical protein L1987_47192 [Smallanthus sonchifolius]